MDVSMNVSGECRLVLEDWCNFTIVSLFLSNEGIFSLFALGHLKVVITVH